MTQYMATIQTGKMNQRNKNEENGVLCHRTIPLIKLTWSEIEGYWPHLFCVCL